MIYFFILLKKIPVVIFCYIPGGYCRFCCCCCCCCAIILPNATESLFDGYGFSLPARLPPSTCSLVHFCLQQGRHGWFCPLLLLLLYRFLGPHLERLFVIDRYLGKSSKQVPAINCLFSSLLRIPTKFSQFELTLPFDIFQWIWTSAFFSWMYRCPASPSRRNGGERGERIEIWWICSRHAQTKIHTSVKHFKCQTWRKKIKIKKLVPLPLPPTPTPGGFPYHLTLSLSLSLLPTCNESRTATLFF